ncbi:Hypp2159 [Branchiostoma lanceolatum]|uniref:Hypp2159 protein n=1 Tax=Branchiostoma lanceolatum TaxID=7740 RepID=A0A8J9ZRN4_BRALA|nr:Hypp2159 [Branchiostoma lanceolatum]
MVSNPDVSGQGNSEIRNLRSSTVYISVAKNVQDYAYFDAAISWKPVKNKSSPPLEYGERPANTKFRMLHPDFIRYLTYK